MTSELIIQNLLASVNRSLRPVFKHWLNTEELERRSEEQTLLFLEKTEKVSLRKQIIASLKPETRALFKNILKNPEVPVGELIAITRSAGHYVSLSSLGEIHYKGLAFFEDPNLWPSAKAEWSDVNAEQTLVFPPAMLNEIIAEQPIDFKCDIYAEKVKPIPDEEPSASILLSEFLDSVSRAEIKLTQHGKLSSRSRKVLSKIWDAHGKSMCTPEDMIDFARDTGILRIDSTGTTIIERKFANFRKAPRAQQMKEFFNYSAEMIEPPEEERIDAVFYVHKFALRMISTILSSTDKEDWLFVKPISEIVSENAREMFSVKKGIRSWFWAFSNAEFPSEKTWKSLTKTLLKNWFAPAGVIEWGKTSRKAKCVRLTEMGRFWLRDEFAPAHKDVDQQLVVQPDFTALLTHSGPWDAVAQLLGLFARRSGNDNASTFQFSQESVSTAVQQGHKVSELLAGLDRHCSYPIPKNVRHSIKEWGSVSPNVTLYRDINLFSFDTEKERDAFIKLNSCKSKKLGKYYALLLIPEDDIFNIMTRIYAKPVDYTDVPIGSIEVKPDGRIVLHAPDDLRLIALRDAISEPVNSEKTEILRDVNFYLSAKSMRNTNFPVNSYDRLVNIPGRPISMNVRLNLLVGFGLLQETPDYEYAILSNFAFSKRNLVRKHFDWKKIILARIARDAFVLLPEHTDAVKEALKKTKIDGKIYTVKMERLPLMNKLESDV
ncbi:MAG: hypothetical protein DRI44_05650 [Chlamydiae bacterium]|nr:MAG: hypothetical protein DRI44_05650 [Chlamydiota bacterium]